MQFYRYAGFTVSEKWAEENDNRRVMREKVRKISMKTNSFNQNQQRKAYAFDFRCFSRHRNYWHHH